MLLIDEKLRDELVRYLLTRPCGEVMQGVIALRDLNPVRPAEDGQPGDLAQDGET